MFKASNHGAAATDIRKLASYTEWQIGMKKWDYVLFSTPAILVATAVIIMIDGHIFGENTNTVATAIGLFGMFIMLFASRKFAAQKARK